MRADVHYYGHSCALTGSGGSWLTSCHLGARWSWSCSADRAENLWLFSRLHCLCDASAGIPARTNPRQEGLCTKEIYMLDSRRFWGSRCREKRSCKVTLEMHSRSKNLPGWTKFLLNGKTTRPSFLLKDFFHALTSLVRNLMTCVHPCLSKDLMIWLNATKKMSKSYENKGIYLHC